MNLLTSPDWIHTIGWTLLHFLWQGAVLSVLLAGVLMLLRRAAPAWRVAAGLGTLALMAACPPVTFAVLSPPGRDAGSPVVPLTVPLPGGELNQPVVVMDESPEPGPARKAPRPVIAAAGRREIAASPMVREGWRVRLEPLMPAAVWLWGAGAALLGLWRLGGWWLAGRWLRAGAPPLSPEWPARLQTLARRCGVRRPVRLLTSLKVAGPVTGGILRPVILFPASLLSGLPPAQVEALIIHELVHIRRLDYLTNLLMTGVETLLFFHPAVWWTTRMIRQETEHCCDDAALACGPQVRDYAGALASLAEYRDGTTGMLPAARGGSLLLRLQRLLSPAPSPWMPAVRMPLSLASAGAALGICVFLANAGEEVRAPGGQQTGEPKAGATEPGPVPIVPAAAPAISGRGRLLDRNSTALAYSAENGDRLYPWGALAIQTLGSADPLKPRTPGMTGAERSFEAALARGEDVRLTLDVPVQLIVEKALRDSGIGRGTVAVIDVADGGILSMGSVPSYLPGEDAVVPPAEEHIIKVEVPPGEDTDARQALDARLQAAVEKALRDPTAGRGVIRVVDSRDGSTLLTASAPVYPPAPLTGKQLTKLMNDPLQPLQNRALVYQGPGSTFKIVTAVAACQAGNGSRPYHCAGRAAFGARPIACWIQKKGGAHGTLGLEEALKVSCNCWFMKAGVDAGMSQIAATGTLLGVGQSSPQLLDMPAAPLTDPATLPDAEAAKWTLSETACVAMGQGRMSATPLQMASVAASIGTGSVWELRLNADSAPRCVQKELLPPEQTGKIRRGLLRVVNDKGGTGARARSDKTVIAGKTGTTQRFSTRPGHRGESDNTAWFIAYAPADKPRYAVCVVVENGEAGGACAAPIARRVIEQVLDLPPGAPPPAVSPVPALKGHFNKVFAVAYPD